MHIDGLKIAGFKSFVDPVDFMVEDGLTGIVGPNGCGKSNILESLRWVMGATSARAMRGGEMDDLIFSGSSNRPQREHCEVTVILDNSARTAPAALNDADVLEVKRRLRRSAGSTYKVNGRTVRAKDIQLLFADASTGANSPALVRQGQISELIASKPQNRRRILEEAAGISGLSARRHEAQLKLRAAAANLEKLDDIIGEVEKQISSLKRQASKARRYRDLNAAIQDLEASLLLERWRLAATDFDAATQALAAARLAVDDGVRAEARTSTQEADTRARILPLRNNESEAAGKLGALKLQLARIDGERQAAKDALARLQSDLARISADQSREHDLRDEAQDKAAAATHALEDLPSIDESERAIARQDLQDSLKAAERELAEQEHQTEILAAQLAAAEANMRAAQSLLEREEKRLSVLIADRARLVEDRDRLGDEAALTAELDEARKTLNTATTVADHAAQTADAAEALATQNRKAAAEAAVPAREAEQARDSLKAEIAGLERLTSGAGLVAKDAVLEEIRPDDGLERALAAALGDDLSASRVEKDAQHWTSRQGAAQLSLPEGAQPLWDVVKAPDVLSARLKQCGLVDVADGPRLQTELKPGQRLVSTNGDMWRWDGFVRTAKAPSPAAERLEHRNRLDKQRKALAKADKAADKMRLKAEQAEADAEDARRSAAEKTRLVPQLQASSAKAREAVLLAEQAVERLHLRTASLGNAIARLDDNITEVQTTIDAARTNGAAGPADSDRTALMQAREAVRSMREAERRYLANLTDFDQETSRLQARRSALEREAQDWSRRAETADKRLNALFAERDAVRRQIHDAEASPADLQLRTDALAGEIQTAEALRQSAADALAEAETALRECETNSRAARDDSGKARELVARNEAQLEAAQRRRDDASEAVNARFDCTPEDLASARSQEGASDAVSVDLPGRERQLSDLKRQLDALGPVNQAADDQLEETAERMEQQLVEREDLRAALDKLNEAVDALNTEGRARLLEAFEVVAGHFKVLFETLFQGGEAELRLTESDDPLQAGLEIYACPPGKRLGTLSLMSGGEQALTAAALIFAVFLSRPSPLCVLDEVDAPLDDANVDRFCRMLDEMRRRTDTRFIVITHNPVTMSRMDRLYGVTMQERGVSKLVSVDLQSAERLVAAE